VAEPIAPGTDALSALQRWMLRVVTHPGGVDEGLAAARAEGLWPAGADELAQVVPGNDRLSPHEQLHIYAYAYQERIREVLASECPTVEHLLGQARFAALVRRYLGDHPPWSFTLDHVGDRLASWLSAHDDPTLQAAADMVRVEQAMDRAFDAPPQASVDPAALAELPMASWAEATLQLRDGLQLLALDHDVMAAMTAAKHGVPAEVPTRRPAWVAAYCADFRRFRRTLDPHEYALARQLQAMRPLGEALQTVATRPDVELAELVPRVQGWFAGWMEAGWVVAVHRP